MTTNPNPSEIEPELIDVRTVAKLLGCSVRTVWRLRDRGAIPQPLILTTNGLVRWRRSTLLAWISEAESIANNAGRRNRRGKK
jgi:predicted DNA-binding transcriptional regulator AlpA